jgi:hypothetical protein
MRLVRRPATASYSIRHLEPDPAAHLHPRWKLGAGPPGRRDAITFAQEDAPDYFVLRASATYRINSDVSFWVRGENLTDHSYQPTLGFLAPSIAGYGGIKISF